MPYISPKCAISGPYGHTDCVNGDTCGCPCHKVAPRRRLKWERERQTAKDLQQKPIRFWYRWW